MDFDPQTAFVGFTCVPTLQSSKSVFHIGISDPIRHSNLKFRLPIVNFWGFCFLLFFNRAILLMITSHIVDVEILFITYLLEIPASQRTHPVDIPHEMRQQNHQHD